MCTKIMVIKYVVTYYYLNKLFLSPTLWRAHPTFFDRGKPFEGLHVTCFYLSESIWLVCPVLVVCTSILYAGSIWMRPGVACQANFREPLVLSQVCVTFWWRRLQADIRTARTHARPSSHMDTKRVAKIAAIKQMQETKFITIVSHLD